jgi:undecaprenyl-phosphate galactose phosphotransferase
MIYENFRSSDRSTSLIPIVQQPRSVALREAAYDALNRLVALFLVLVLSPVLLAVLLAIRITDPGPVFFGHYRVGRGGRLIKVLKFRSMRVDAQQRLAELLASDVQARAEWERDFKLSDDPRVTRTGRFLRRSSLDELPQLFNVLKGEMRLVGPRPITAQELRRYGSARWHYLSVTPGVTGLWQVSGRNELSYAERVELDRYYVDNRSLLLDASILCRTVLVVTTGRGAC